MRAGDAGGSTLHHHCGFSAFCRGDVSFSVAASWTRQFFMTSVITAPIGEGGMVFLGAIFRLLERRQRRMQLPDCPTCHVPLHVDVRSSSLYALSV